MPKLMSAHGISGCLAHGCSDKDDTDLCGDCAGHLIPYDLIRYAFYHWIKGKGPSSDIPFDGLGVFTVTLLLCSSFVNESQQLIYGANLVWVVEYGVLMWLIPQRFVLTRLFYLTPSASLFNLVFPSILITQLYHCYTLFGFLPPNLHPGFVILY